MNAQLIIDPQKAEIHFNDSRIEYGRSQTELQAVILEALIIRAYVKAEMSLGEVAELTGKNVEEAMNWLHSEGVSTSRKLTPEAQAITDAGLKKITAALGLKLHS